MIPTKERLAQVLHAEALFDLERKARAGDFDDYESDSATPIVDLVMALERLGKHKLADRARNGEFDGSKEEAEAWAKREGFSLGDNSSSSK